MRLYHFTCLFHLPSILAAGLNRGDEVLGPTQSLNVPSFTTNPNRNAVHWNDGGLADKRKVRILVDVPDDENAVPWRELMKRYNVRRDIVKAVDWYGQGKFWWVYLGTVKPERFVSIEVFDGQEYVAQDADRLHSLVADIEAELKKFTMHKEGGATQLHGEDSWLFDGEDKQKISDDAIAWLRQVKRIDE